MAQASNSGATPPTSTASTWAGEVDLGFQWVGGTNTGLFGRYNGLTDEGLDLLGDFAFSNRDPKDSGKTSYFDVTGNHLVIQTGDRLSDHFSDSRFRDSTNNYLGPNSSLQLSLGDQGTWGVTAGYDSISYAGNIINSIYTMHGTTGVLNNGLLPYGGASNDPLTPGPTTSFTTTTLSPAEQEFQVGTRRDILQLAGKYLFGDWTVSSSIRHEHKQGSLEESLDETYGGQTFAMPVDYDTDRLDVSATYQTPDLQAVLQYSYMHFEDSNSAFVLPFPVSLGSLNSSSGPYAQAGLYAAPPSNSAHYVTAMVGDNLAPRTRLTLNGRFGVELQNDSFPANSADPNLSSTLGAPTYSWFSHLNAANQGTTASSPNAVAWVYQANLAVNSSLSDDFDGRLSYSFDGRSVHLNQFEVWTGGHAPDAAQTTPYFVVPQNWFNQTADAQLTYKIDPASNTKLTADYSFNNVNRTNAQVEHSITNTGSLELSSMIGTDFLGRLTYEHSERNSTLIYGTAWGNIESGAPALYDTPSGAYYQAPMTSDSVTLRANYAPAGQLTGGFFLRYVNEDYNYPAIPMTAPSGDWTLVGQGEGIKRDYNLTVGPDINYRPSADWNLHAYYTYERIYFDNLGNGQCAESNTGDCAGSVGYWRSTYTSGMNTAGFSANWQATEKLKIEAEFDHSSGSVLFGEFNGVMVTNVSQSFQNVVPYPDVHSEMNDVRLTADYKATDSLDWAVIYRFSSFHNNDWNDLTAPVQASTNTGTAISILTPGYGAPHYNVSLIGTVLKVRL